MKCRISQGCLLSLFLFSILMMVLLHDAEVMFRGNGCGEFDKGLVLNELVYADDTLIFETNTRVNNILLHPILQL